MEGKILVADRVGPREIRLHQAGIRLGWEDPGPRWDRKRDALLEKRAVPWWPTLAGKDWEREEGRCWEETASRSW